MKAFITGTLTAIALTFAAAPAFADEYYVVQDTATKKCTVVDKKPTVTTMTILGGTVVYKTRTEADDAMGKVVVCTTK